MLRLTTVCLVFAVAQGIVVSQRGKITGGGHESIEKVPWQILLQNYRMPHCGGTILSENFILTSAACAEDLDTNEVSVLSGTDTIWGDDGIVTNISNVVLHPKYDGVNNNVAVLKLADKLVLGPKQKAAVLSDVVPSCDETVKFTGFGSTRDGFPTTPMPYDMRSINLAVWPAEICSYYLGDYADKNNLVCAGINDGPCFGDQGGAITLAEKVVGISVKENCYNPRPALFVRVGPYKTFIDEASLSEAVWE